MGWFQIAVGCFAFLVSALGVYVSFRGIDSARRKRWFWRYISLMFALFGVGMIFLGGGEVLGGADRYDFTKLAGFFMSLVMVLGGVGMFIIVFRLSRGYPLYE
jgi:hypothetical protein